jgi:hypothetical protein
MAGMSNAAVAWLNGQVAGFAVNHPDSWVGKAVNGSSALLSPPSQFEPARPTLPSPLPPQ